MTSIRSSSPGDRPESSSWLNAFLACVAAELLQASGSALVLLHRKNSQAGRGGGGWRRGHSSTIPKKHEVGYQLLKSTLNWLSNGTLVLRVLLRRSKQGEPPPLGIPNMWTNTGINAKQLGEVTTIMCLWRSHCNIQLSVNGRDRLLSHRISHYLTVTASWKSHLQAMAPYSMYRIGQT